jgi:hypothetical protein
MRTLAALLAALDYERQGPLLLGLGQLCLLGVIAILLLILVLQNRRK